MYCNFDTAKLKISLPAYYKECLDAWSELNRKTPSSSHEVINPLTPGTFCQNAFFGHFGGFEAGLGQISFNLVKNALLATKITFYELWAHTRAEIKILKFWTRRWPTSLGFSIFDFFFLSFFSFSFLFAAGIDLLLGLLAVKKLLRKSH